MYVVITTKLKNADKGL